jgi:hypothetical protein
MIVLKESTVKGETAETTISAPPSIKELYVPTRAKNPTTFTAEVSDPHLHSKRGVPTRDFFSPLRSIEMEADRKDSADDTTKHQQHQAPSSQAGSPPPFVLTSQVNLIESQRQLKSNLEFHNTRNGTRVVTKEMEDFSAIHSHFKSSNLPYFTFYPKSQKPIKAVIWHLLISSPAEYISDGLVNLGFDVNSGKYLPPI